MFNAGSLRVAFKQKTPTLLVCLAAIGGCAYTIVNNGSLNQTRAQRVEQGIAKFRQLAFTQPVPLVVKSPDQVQQMLSAELKRDHSDHELELGGRTGAMTGVYPAGMDLKSSTLSLMHSQIAGFYDPHDKEMVLVDGAINASFWNSAASFVRQRDTTGEMILAHELTHALQDQHFHIEQMMDAVKDNDDRDLALKALAEGDATVSGFGYVDGNLDNSTLNTILLRLANLPKILTAQSGNVPLGLTAPLVFQYYDGARFVAYGYRRGRWGAVDAIYQDPPQTTFQVMHPARYFDHTFTPSKVTLSGYQNYLKDWHQADDDTYGAFLIQLILRRGLGDDAPAVALADQWMADRLIVLQRGESLTILWLISFSDATSANQFASVYARILNRIPAAQPFRIAAKDHLVLAVIGEGSRSFDQFEPAVWTASGVTPESASSGALMVPRAAAAVRP